MEKIVMVVFVLLIIGCGFGLLMSVKASTAFANDCQHKGGHTVSLSKGNMLCLSTDGRVIGTR